MDDPDQETPASDEEGGVFPGRSGLGVMAAEAEGGWDLGREPCLGVLPPAAANAVSSPRQLMPVRLGVLGEVRGRLDVGAPSAELATVEASLCAPDRRAERGLVLLGFALRARRCALSPPPLCIINLLLLLSKNSA